VEDLLVAGTTSSNLFWFQIHTTVLGTRCKSEEPDVVVLYANQAFIYTIFVLARLSEMMSSTRHWRTPAQTSKGRGITEETTYLHRLFKCAKQELLQSYTNHLRVALILIHLER
jgi:hypothetical protein